MSHIVIHTDLEGETQYRRFDELGEAVAYLEEQRNSGAATDAELFALNPVRFEVKPYFRVEVVDDAALAAPAEMPEDVISSDTVDEAGSEEPEAVEEHEPEPSMEHETVEGFEDDPFAALDVFGPEAHTETVPDFPPPPPPMPLEAQPEVRRGLFGR